MTEARNDYPRLCWGCLGEIARYEDDAALLTYGGYHRECRDEMLFLRPALEGYPEKMNDCSQAFALQQQIAFLKDRTYDL